MDYSKKSLEESFDIDDECLDSAFRAVQNLSVKPFVYTHSIKTNEAELAVADIKELSDIAYVNRYSTEIHVLSSNEDFEFQLRSKEEEGTSKENSDASEENGPKLRETNILQHPADVTALSYTNGHLLMSGCLDGTVKVWDRNYEILNLYSDVTKFLSDIHASSILDYFVTSSLCEQISDEGETLYGASLFSFSRNFPIASFLGHTAGTQSVQFHPNGLYVATASQDNTIKLWSTQKYKPVRTYQDEKAEPTHWKKIAFSPDGKYLTSTYYGSVKIWDLGSNKLVKTLGSVNPNCNSLNICFSESGKELAAGGSNRELKIWNMKNFENCVATSDMELIDCYALNQDILKIRGTKNIFSCVGAESIAASIEPKKPKKRKKNN